LAVKKRHENKLSVAEIGMCGKTIQDRIRNNNIRGRVWVAPIVEKMAKTRLSGLGIVERRHVDYVVRRVCQMEENQITRTRGRPRKTIKKDLEVG
jgi:hypothetical protein